MMKIVQFLRIVAVSMAAGVLLTGCATLPRDSFSLSEDAIASPAGFANVRFTENSPALTAAMEKALTPDAHGDVTALALSGGGANGAYGAGLVYGWGKSGAMPKFQLVTGVSTGALTAPFAFLGRDWSEQLRKSYLEGKVYVLLKGRGLLSLITPGLFSRAPLDDLVRGYVTDDLLRAVAAEQRAPRADWAAAAFPWDARVQQLLGEVFGLGGFRPLQREVINATMQVGAGCWTLAERL